MTMLALDDGALLTAWDRAATLARPWREVALLAAASGEPLERLARLPIGERDRLLLDFRVAMFGECFECETTCPECTVRLELSLNASDLLVPPSAGDWADLQLPEGNCSVRLRAPDSVDLAACMELPEGAVRVLLERCSQVVDANGEAQDLPALTVADRAIVANRLAELDPQADVAFHLSCPDCSHHWLASFDSAGFLLQEVAGYVERVLDEVHLLASAYCWSEMTILSMESSRRKGYLARVLQ